MIRSFGGKRPRLAEGVFVDDSAQVIGDVELGEDASVWPGAVLRGDVHYIRIGARTNIQDLTVIHVSEKTHPQTGQTRTGTDFCVLDGARSIDGRHA